MKKTLIILAFIGILASCAGALSFGFEDGIPYLHYQLSDSRSIDFGITGYGYSSLGESDVMGLIRFQNQFAEVGKLRLSLGLQAMAEKYYSNYSGNIYNWLSIGGVMGMEYMLIDQLSLYSNIILIQYGKSQGGGSTSEHLDFLQSPWSNIFTGIRVYF